MYLSHIYSKNIAFNKIIEFNKIRFLKTYTFLSKSILGIVIWFNKNQITIILIKKNIIIIQTDIFIWIILIF